MRVEACGNTERNEGKALTGLRGRRVVRVGARPCKKTAACVCGVADGGCGEASCRAGPWFSDGSEVREPALCFGDRRVVGAPLHGPCSVGPFPLAAPDDEGRRHKKYKQNSKIPTIRRSPYGKAYRVRSTPYGKPRFQQSSRQNIQVFVCFQPFGPLRLSPCPVPVRRQRTDAAPPSHCLCFRLLESYNVSRHSLWSLAAQPA